MRRHWGLDPAVAFLNHGSYGACPSAVLAEQSRLRAEMEADPVRFFNRTLPPRLDEALGALGGFIGADAADLAFVPNATAGVNAVLRSLDFRPGDEILVTDHSYEACANAAAYVAARTGARVVVAHVAFPLSSRDEVVTSVLAAAGPRVRLALLDHVTSATALVWPLAELVAALSARGIDTLVDGAHAPGMIALDIGSLGAAYYTGNCHKWICAPKGAGFLHVRRDRQDGVAPVAVSGMTKRTNARSALRSRFDWTGTWDPTAALSVPAALRHMGSLVPGGWPFVMAANHALALRARDILCAALRVDPPAPDDMLGAMASLAIPGKPAHDEPDEMQERLAREGIEVPIIPWGNPRRRLLRVSAQLYNTEEEFRRLAAKMTLP